MPSMVVNCLMSGVATDFAMVSGDAPDRSAETLMVGKSVRGSAATGNRPNANSPPTISAIDINKVATGRRMQNSETFIAAALSLERGPSPLAGEGCGAL